MRRNHSYTQDSSPRPSNDLHDSSSNYIISTRYIQSTRYHPHLPVSISLPSSSWNSVPSPTTHNPRAVQIQPPSPQKHPRAVGRIRPAPALHYQLTNPAFLLNPPLTISKSTTFPSKIVFFTIPSTSFGATLANQIPCPSFFL